MYSARAVPVLCPLQGPVLSPLQGLLRYYVLRPLQGLFQYYVPCNAYASVMSPAGAARNRPLQSPCPRHVLCRAMPVSSPLQGLF